MARSDKTAAVAELTEGFRRSSAVVLTEYRGLTVAQLKELRRTLGEHVTYSVVKNTLTRIAARDAKVSGLDDLLAGPSAIAFVSGDPVDAAKGLRDFSRAHPLLVIKGGLMEGRPLSADEIRRLADLESREVLLARLAGAMKASLSGAVALFAAPLAQTARLIEALRQKAEQDPSVLRGESGTIAPDPAGASAHSESEGPSSDSAATVPSSTVAETDGASGEDAATPVSQVADSDAAPNPVGITGSDGGTEPAATAAATGTSESAASEQVNGSDSAGSDSAGSDSAPSTPAGSAEAAAGNETAAPTEETTGTDAADSLAVRHSTDDATPPANAAGEVRQTQENTEG